MRRLGSIFLGVLMLHLSVQAPAQSQVESVRIDVELQDDGSALVSETWVIDVDDEITEWYLGKENLGKRSISDFGVTDETGTVFVSEGTGWDINRGRAQKYHRCGIVNKTDGCELCWGVGSEGLHTYTATYTLSDLVQGYSDMDGFNFMFVTETDGEPQEVSLTIRKRGTIFTSDSTHVWGFGFNGEVEVLDGAVKYWSTEPFSSRSRLIALVGFEKGIFSPEVVSNDSFETVKKKAFKGSDYKKDSGDWVDKLISILFIGIIVGLAGLVVILLIYAAIDRKKTIKKLLGGKEKDVNWFRDIPVEGDLRKATNIMKLVSSKFFSTTMKDETHNLLAAYMMRLFYRGAFKLVPDGSGDMNFKVEDLVLTDEEASGKDHDMEMDVYNFFKEAAGSDAILQKKELRKWANSHGGKLYRWQQKIKDGSSLKTLKAKDVQEVYGLKKYLKDFTLIKDRGTVEVGLWNNYLIFASLYGISEQVFKDFKKVCPEYFSLCKQMEQFQDQKATPVVLWNTIDDTSRYFNNSAANYAARQRASSGSGSRYGGGGGHTSFGGGGGFSGGGHSGGR